MKKENLEILKKIFGPSIEDAQIKLEKSEPEFASFIEDYAIEKIWSRSRIPLREKSMITIASQVAMGRWDQVRNHMEGFLNLGGTKDELKEILFHLSVYCGFPATLSGLEILREISEKD